MFIYQLVDSCIVDAYFIQSCNIIVVCSDDDIGKGIVLNWVSVVVIEVKIWVLLYLLAISRTQAMILGVAGWRVNVWCLIPRIVRRFKNQCDIWIFTVNPRHMQGLVLDCIDLIVLGDSWVL